MFGCTKPGGRPLKEGSSRLDSLKGKKGATCAVKRKSDGVTIYYRTAKGRNIEDKAKATRMKKRAAHRTRLQKLKARRAEKIKGGEFVLGRRREKPKGEKEIEKKQPVEKKTKKKPVKKTKPATQGKIDKYGIQHPPKKIKALRKKYGGVFSREQRIKEIAPTVLNEIFKMAKTDLVVPLPRIAKKLSKMGVSKIEIDEVLQKYNKQLPFTMERASSLDDAGGVMIGSQAYFLYATENSQYRGWKKENLKGIKPAPYEREMQDHKGSKEKYSNVDLKMPWTYRAYGARGVHGRDKDLATYEEIKGFLADKLRHNKMMPLTKDPHLNTSLSIEEELKRVFPAVDIKKSMRVARENFYRVKGLGGAPDRLRSKN